MFGEKQFRQDLINDIKSIVESTTFWPFSEKDKRKDMDKFIEKVKGIIDNNRFIDRKDLFDENIFHFERSFDNGDRECLIIKLSKRKAAYGGEYAEEFFIRHIKFGKDFFVKESEVIKMEKGKKTTLHFYKQI